MLRHKPSATLLVACLALFVALGGTGLAASRYLITRTSQIKPAVLRTIMGAGPEREIVSAQATIAPGHAATAAVAACPGGYHALSGGYLIDELGPDAYVVDDQPTIGGSGWRVLLNDPARTGTSRVQAVALCAPGQPGYIPASSVIH